MNYEDVPFAGKIPIPEDDCEQAFFDTFPSCFEPNKAALQIWTIAWQTSRIKTLEEVRALIRNS